VIGVVFVILIGIVLVLLLMSGGGSGGNSPSGALTGYADGFNDGDMKDALDHTLLVFMPNYEDIVASFDGIDINDVVTFEYKDIEVIYESSMTADQLQEAQYMVDEINMTLDIEVQETAIVEYTMSIEYTGYDIGPVTFDGDMVVVKVDGAWYLAMLSAPDPFDY
jgi:hypothetical protein